MGLFDQGIISKLSSNRSNAETDVLSNGEEIRAKIISSITNARSEIILAVAYFTDREIAGRLIDANNRGVKVQVLLSNAQMNSDVRSILANKNVVVYQIEDSLMHAKFIVIDDSIVINGSYNYTLRASRENKEVVNVSYGKEIKSYKLVFMELVKGLTRVQPEEDLEFSSGNIEVDKNVFADRLEAIVFTTLDDHDKEKMEQLGNDEAASSQANPEIFSSRIDQFSQTYRDKLVRNDSVLEIIKGKLYNLGLSEKKLLSEKFERWEIQEKYDIEQKLEEIKIQREDLVSKKEELSNEKDRLNKDVKGFELDKEQIEESIDRLLVTSKVVRFLNLGNGIRMSFLVVISLILSVFFASSLYNLLSLKDAVQYWMDNGGDMPQGFPIYLDILTKLRNTYGSGGFSALFLFLLPLMISNIGIVTPKLNKIAATLFSVVFGMLFIDIIVAINISKVLHEANNMMFPPGTEFNLLDAVKKGDIFLVFIFGFLPLMMSHFLLGALSEAYVKSRPELMEKENYAEQKVLKNNLKKIDQKILPIKLKIDDLILKIEALKSDLDSLTDLANDARKVSKENVDLKRNRILIEEEKIDALVGRYIAMIERGDKAILKKATESVATSYMHGFKSYITDYFSERISQEKIRLVQLKFDSWVARNFDQA